MKKIILIALTMCIGFVSCKSPSEKLIDKINQDISKNFTKTLKDPSSYQSVETILEDTFTKKEFIENKIQMYEAINPLWSSAEIKQHQDKLTPELTLLKAQLKSGVNMDSIMFIGFKHKYRAKNGFGAVDLFTLNVIYLPKEDKIKY